MAYAVNEGYCSYLDSTKVITLSLRQASVSSYDIHYPYVAFYYIPYEYPVL